MRLPFGGRFWNWMKAFELENKNYAMDTVATLKRWLENRNNNLSFVDYFHEYQCSTIAIFDAGEIGRLLYEEIKGSDIKVAFFIDRNAEGIHNIDGIPVIPINKIAKQPEVDIIVVSPVYNYEEVLRLFMEVNKELRSIALKEAVYEFIN